MAGKRASERLIEYARTASASSEHSDVTPSTPEQFRFARRLEKELLDIGAEDVLVDDHSYVYAKLPATQGYEDKTAIGFLAHLDTVPDFPGESVSPRVVEAYDGGDIALGESGRVLSPESFPHLRALHGKTLIVTDGTTLLGADDKAGIAEIMTAAERICNEKIPHGPLSFAFCPDEEIGHGASLLDLTRFGAELAYTVDGGAPNEIEYENFNAASAAVEFHGVSVHPGSAKGVMVNASLAAFQFHAMLPDCDTPRSTEGREGFFHLTQMEGNVDHARLEYIIRDHDAAAFEQRKQLMSRAAKQINEQYGADTVRLVLQDQYRNMLERIKPRFEVVEKAMAAMRSAGVEPIAVPIRGGTDGAQLSYRGLPCPNLPTGSYCHHGPYEHAVAEQMDLIVEILLAIVREFSL